MGSRRKGGGSAGGRPGWGWTLTSGRSTTLDSAVNGNKTLCIGVIICARTSFTLLEVKRSAKQGQFWRTRLTLKAIGGRG